MNYLNELQKAQKVLMDLDNFVGPRLEAFIKDVMFEEEEFPQEIWRDFSFESLQLTRSSGFRVVLSSGCEDYDYFVDTEEVLSWVKETVELEQDLNTVLLQKLI